MRNSFRCSDIPDVETTRDENDFVSRVFVKSFAVSQMIRYPNDGDNLLSQYPYARSYQLKFNFCLIRVLNL